MIAVLDTGGVSGLAPIDETRRARLRALRRRVDDLLLPAAVLAEGVLSGHPGRDHHVRRLLELVSVAEVDAGLGCAAGSLRTKAAQGGAEPLPSGVDATVVALADERAASDGVVLITTDPDDLEQLAVFAEHLDRLTIRSV